jgi:AcrR family transcriptional regulator
MDFDKKECILTAATKYFTRFGFKKASVDEIARHAGVAKGTIYLACASKEDLFYQALHRETRAWVADCARLIDPRAPADQLLMAVSLAGIEALEQRPLVRDLLLGKCREMLPAWGPRLDELRELGRAFVVEILRLGVRQGRFRAGLDVEEVALLLQDLQLATYVFHYRGDARDPKLVRRAKAGFDLVLNGLRAKPAP